MLTTNNSIQKLKVVVSRVLWYCGLHVTQLSHQSVNMLFECSNFYLA